MKAIRHALGQPFVTATGAAALVHSTWALGTLFAGNQPDPTTQLLNYLGWLVPALLIAFALDVGQIVTSAEIREHGLTWGRGLTFFVFAGATYYLQWLYIAHHIPALPIAAGVSDIARGTALSLRDAALWIVPALLPLSTLLYTLSGKQGNTAAERESGTAPAPKAAAGPLLNVQGSPELPRLVEDEQETREVVPIVGEIIEEDGIYTAKYGHWSKNYSTLASAQRALSGYKGRYRQMTRGQYAQR